MSVERRFVALPADGVYRAGHGSHLCQGLYHLRSGEPAPSTAFIATHYNVDFTEHYLADLLAERGFGFLGWNTRFRGAEGYFVLDHALAALRSALPQTPPPILLVEGNTLAVSPTMVDVDVASFERCVADGTPDDVLERYTSAGVEAIAPAPVF